MGKVAVLKIGSGSFEQGFEVLLQVKTDDNRLLSELEGRLPPNPGIEGCYISWQTRFRRLKTSNHSRRRLQQETEDAWEIDESLPSHRSTPDDFSRCQRLVRDVEKRMKQWLQSSTPQWQCIRERLGVESANESQEVRLVIQARNPRLWKLPWHVWDILEQHNIGIGYTLPGFSAHASLPQSSSRSKKVRILAVLGDKRHLDLQPDQDAIQKLKGTDVTFLHQPRSTQFIRTLRHSKGWDILFFAGHSKTEEKTGRISLSETESLRLDEFKNTLGEAINNGLKIAIFNSCDGLGLAQELIQSKIPVVIVMQEAVPDVVAQSFLKELLAEYSAGQSLYSAVAIAQKRLEDFQELPGSTWLPLIFQNIATVPPSWLDFKDSKQSLSRNPEQKLSDARLEASSGTSLQIRKQRRRFQRITIALCISLITAFLMIFLRDVGNFEWVELKAFDHLMQIRPAEALDERLLIIDITKKDVDAQVRSEDEGKTQSINDAYLQNVLEKLETLEPRVIGLDVYRDYKIKPKYKSLINRLEKDNNLITICEVGQNTLNSGRAPSPQVKQAQNWERRIGFSNLAFDQDNIIRRQLIVLEPPKTVEVSPCQSELSFNLLVALHYLGEEGIVSDKIYSERRNFQLDNVMLNRLTVDAGNYPKIETEQGQLLLNYRASGLEAAPKITLTEFLNTEIDPALVKDKIVLIGTSDPDFQTLLRTPYGEMPLVQLQAHMISQIISAVEDGRTLLGWWPQWKEDLWILCWALIGGLFARWFRPLIAITVALPTLWVLHRYSYILLIDYGLWVPLVPPAVAFLFAMIATTVFYRSLRT